MKMLEFIKKDLTEDVSKYVFRKSILTFTNIHLAMFYENDAL